MKNPLMVAARLASLIALAAAPVALFAADTPFVLLTGQDGPLAQGAAQGNLPAFLNNIYTIAIGFAVVFAILQIIRGGIMWMLTDSFAEKNQGKHLITIAVMGLILILSPVIVFNIINPQILKLDISQSLKDLGPDELQSGGGFTPAEDLTAPLTGTFVSRGTFAVGDSSSEAYVKFMEDCRSTGKTNMPLIAETSSTRTYLCMKNELARLYWIEGDGPYTTPKDFNKVDLYVQECQRATGKRGSEVMAFSEGTDITDVRDYCSASDNFESKPELFKTVVDDSVFGDEIRYVTVQGERFIACNQVRNLRCNVTDVSF